MKFDMPLFENITYTWHGFPYAYLHTLNKEEKLFAGGVNIFNSVLSSYDFKTGEYKQVKLADSTLGFDDHNMVATAYTDKLMVFYVGHNRQNRINYRVNPHNTDIYGLSEEKHIEAPGVIAYMSVLNDDKGNIYLISRIDVDQWYMWWSDDNGDNWSNPVPLSASPRSTGANYVNAGKRMRSDSEAGIVFAGHGSWGESGNQTIHYFNFDLESGDLKTLDGNVVANVKTGQGLPLERSQGTQMYDGAKPATIQNTFGWGSSETRIPIISYVTYNTNENGDYISGNYELAYWDDDAQQVINMTVVDNITGKVTEPHHYGGIHMVGYPAAKTGLGLALSLYNEDTRMWEMWRYYSQNIQGNDTIWNTELVDENRRKLIRPVNVYNNSGRNPVDFMYMQGYFHMARFNFNTDLKTILTKDK